MGKVFIGHVKENLILYSIVFIFFLGGIIAGTLAINFLEQSCITHLNTFLDNFLHQFDSSGLVVSQSIYQAFINAFKEMLMASIKSA